MDESGNGDGTKFLLVGAVEPLGDPEEFEARIVERYRELSARQDLVGLESFDEFRRKGFHAASDLPAISMSFRELMRVLPFRAYVYMTNGDFAAAGATEKERFAWMYDHLLADLLIRFRDEDEIELVIEENDGLRSVFDDLSRTASEHALRKLGRRAQLPTLTTRVEPKMGMMSTAVIDYVMCTIRRWVLDLDRRVDPKEWWYRDFRAIEPALSVLRSLEETDMVVTRRRPLH